MMGFRLGRELASPSFAMRIAVLAIGLMTGGCGAHGTPSPQIKGDIAADPGPGSPPNNSTLRPAFDVPGDVAAATPCESPASGAQFRECAIEAGIEFRHLSPLTPERHLHLFMGSGLAWLDYDHDGWPDLFVCQGAPWNAARVTVGLAGSSRLYRNQGDGTFTDVTESAGLLQLGYSMGTAVGDFNNDGHADLYVSRFGRNQLYCNQGDGTFEPVVEAVSESSYGSSCTFADIDGDGDLDLYIANYLELSEDHYPLCTDTIDDIVYGVGCHPRFLPAAADFLFRNEGDGRFVDVSESAGLRADTARQGLGVVAADFDGDADTDFYVANDSTPNQLWINDGGGRFEDHALQAGVALNRIGLAEAGMGVGTADADGDGRLDLFVTNFFNESNTFYRNDGAWFTDVSDEVGLAASSRTRLGFGASWIDVDNDGWEDLLVANGHIHNHLAGEPFEQLPQIYRNLAGRRFADVSAGSGDYFSEVHVGRGTAVADFNNDGRSDVAIQHLNGQLALLVNETETLRGPGLQLELIGVTSNRDGLGASVTVVVGRRRLLRARHGSDSYLSCNESRLTIGLDGRAAADRVEVRWPTGRTEAWDKLAAGPSHRLVEGTGQALP